MKYVIVQAYTLDGLMEKVNGMLETYEPLGGPFSTNRVDWFAQAMRLVWSDPHPPTK